MIDCQDPIGAAVEEEQPFAPIGGEAARVGNAAIIAERTEKPAAEVKPEKRAKSVSVVTCRACDEERYLDCLLRRASGPSNLWFKSAQYLLGLMSEISMRIFRGENLPRYHLRWLLVFVFAKDRFSAEIADQVKTILPLI